MKRVPAIVRTPVFIGRSSVIGSASPKRILEMQRAEKLRRERKRVYTRYKNQWFIRLFIEATGYNDFSKYELARLKELRKLIEEDFNVPINYFSAFIYKTAYDFFSWHKHNRKNAIGFFSNQDVIKNFSYWLSEQSFSWRKRRSRYPEGFERKWGRRLNIVSQRLGIGNDEVFEQSV